LIRIDSLKRKARQAATEVEMSKPHSYTSCRERCCTDTPGASRGQVRYYRGVLSLSSQRRKHRSPRLFRLGCQRDPGELRQAAEMLRAGDTEAMVYVHKAYASQFQ